MGKKILIFIFLITSIFIIKPTAIYASPAPRLCELTKIIEQVINIAIGAGGVAAFIIFLMGGIQWLTAGANDQAVAQAKSTITWGIIGIVLLISSYFLIVIISTFTGVQIIKTIEFPWIDHGGIARPNGC